MPLNPQALSLALTNAEIAANGAPLAPDALARVTTKNDQIATAMLAFVIGATVTVNTAVTLPPGAVVVATAGTPAAQIGASTAPSLGTGQGAGVIT